MEIAKQKFNVYKELPSIMKMLVGNAISLDMGKPVNFITKHMALDADGNPKAPFTESSLAQLNEKLWQLGQTLMATTIDYSSDRQEVIDQVRSKLRFVRMPYIYSECMGKNKLWYTSRMTHTDCKAGLSTYKKEDIDLYNQYIGEIAIRLLRTELVL